MKITIAGVHMDTGSTLQAHCEEKLVVLKKYFEHVLEIDVAFNDEGVNTEAEVSLFANGIHLHATGVGADAYQAIDDAASKLERQLQKYKGRLNKHIKRRQHNEEKLKVLESLAVVHHSVDDEQDDDTSEETWLEDYAPKVNKKTVSKVAPMSVDEAIMQMDLLHKPAFLFQNAQTGTLNVVYREGDGSVKWVEPSAASAAASA